MGRATVVSDLEPDPGEGRLTTQERRARHCCFRCASEDGIGPQSIRSRPQAHDGQLQRQSQDWRRSLLTAWGLISLLGALCPPSLRSVRGPALAVPSFWQVRHQDQQDRAGQANADTVPSHVIPGGGGWKWRTGVADKWTRPGPSPLPMRWELFPSSPQKDLSPPATPWAYSQVTSCLEDPFCGWVADLTGCS